jgi:purine-binding chemotaxis protein CheW
MRFPMNEMDKRQILRERARLLAAEPLKKEASENHLEVLEFFLAYENYAIETSYVREVYPLNDFTPLPCVPAFVLGIVNVRGRIIPVIDLKKFFDLPEKGLGELNKIIIIREAEMEFGILADALLGIRKISRERIKPAPAVDSSVRTEYVKGITDERLIILETGKILSDRKIIVQEGGTQ